MKSSSGDKRLTRKGGTAWIAAVLFAWLVGAAVAVVADDMIEVLSVYGPQYFAELQDAELANGLLYVFGVGGLDILNISNPAAPISLGRYEPDAHPYERYYRGVVGPTMVYAGAREDLLQVIDVTNPVIPHLVTKHGSPGMSYEGAALAGSILLACRHGDGVEVLDVTAPGDPTTLAEVTSLTNSWNAAIVGDHAYVADGAGGLAVLDLSSPETPIHVGSIATSGNALDVAAIAGLVVVACGSSGVDVFNTANPDVPVLTATYDSPGLAVSVKLDGDTLYLADWKSTEIVDLSNASAPQLVGHEETPVRAMGLAAAAGLIYVTDWSTVRSYAWRPSLRGDIQTDAEKITFPDVAVGETLDKVLTITNTGGADLDVTNVESFGADFVIQPPLSFVIPAGGGHEVVVSFTRTSSAYDGTFMRVSSDDSDEGSITLPLSAGDNLGQLDIGDQAPDFSLTDLGGAVQELRRYRGRVVVMAFFANW